MLFIPFKPMEPVAAASVPQGRHLLYQVKWDGVRIIAHVGNGRVMLHNRKLRERTLHYPELNRLKQTMKGEAVFDGEVVAMKEGSPSFPLVLKRDLALPSGAEKARRLMAMVPVVYMVFDIVYHNGSDLTGVPLAERQNILAETLPVDEHIHFVESFWDGVALFAAVAGKKMEGIVAKDTESCYAAGKKLPVWQKIKVRLQQLVTVGGYTSKEGQINALLAGAYHGGQFLYLGRVAAGLSGGDLAELTPFLSATQRPSPPFVNAPAAKDKIWVEPKLTMLVDFLEWTDDLRMRQPVIKGFTKDKPEDCLLGG